MRMKVLEIMDKSIADYGIFLEVDIVRTEICRTYSNDEKIICSNCGCDQEYHNFCDAITYIGQDRKLQSLIFNFKDSNIKPDLEECESGKAKDIIEAYINDKEPNWFRIIDQDTRTDCYPAVALIILKR